MEQDENPLMQLLLQDGSYKKQCLELQENTLLNQQSLIKKYRAESNIAMNKIKSEQTILSNQIKKQEEVIHNMHVETKQWMAAIDTKLSLTEGRMKDKFDKFDEIDKNLKTKFENIFQDYQKQNSAQKDTIQNMKKDIDDLKKHSISGDMHELLTGGTANKLFNMVIKSQENFKTLDSCIGVIGHRLIEHKEYIEGLERKVTEGRIEDIKKNSENTQYLLNAMIEIKKDQGHVLVSIKSLIERVNKMEENQSEEKFKQLQNSIKVLQNAINGANHSIGVLQRRP